MAADFFSDLIEARTSGQPFVVVTVVETEGSVPRHPGAKMVVLPDGSIRGTVGGGKFESLVIVEAQKRLLDGQNLLKKYSLREGESDSFGAICGGQVTLWFEPQKKAPGLLIVGAGHCAQSIAKLAAECGFHVTVVDDRKEWTEICPGVHRKITEQSAQEVIREVRWTGDDAIVLVSRSFMLDRDALEEAVKVKEVGYLGMIGSRKKVLQVYDELKAKGVKKELLERVYAPIGLDIGSDTPAEIAVSVLAEILQVLRKAKGGHLKKLKSDL
ncbi:MAG: xanthine dehydrogenase accessory protein XdhC [Verrucomicrobia bacterium]|nr:xanthine dehydrogenase accessory protein XdhC [Verrucomicrobiota bacterium]